MRQHYIEPLYPSFGSENSIISSIEHYINNQIVYWSSPDGVLPDWQMLDKAGNWTQIQYNPNWTSLPMMYVYRNIFNKVDSWLKLNDNTTGSIIKEAGTYFIKLFVTFQGGDWTQTPLAYYNSLPGGAVDTGNSKAIKTNLLPRLRNLNSIWQFQTCSVDDKYGSFTNNEYHYIDDGVVDSIAMLDDGATTFTIEFNHIWQSDGVTPYQNMLLIFYGATINHIYSHLMINRIS